MINSSAREINQFLVTWPALIFIKFFITNSFYVTAMGEWLRQSGLWENFLLINVTELFSLIQIKKKW